MGKKKPIEPSAPSKAYLVSFGDTMTALLAFFIVLNSLAQEQTGANMYSGTGSFVNSFASSGLPGGMPLNRSKDMLQQESQMPIYALSDNMDQNLGKVGPDDVDEKQRIIDRDNEQFQKFLSEINDTLDLKSSAELTNQLVFDSFEPFDRGTGGLSKHAIQLLSEAFARLRRPNVQVEIIVWANIPSQKNLASKLDRTLKVREEVESRFSVNPKDKRRISYRTKPWLFSDAKRPIISIVVSEVAMQQG